tara:strand:+ start:1555 stop:1860 length:306 start_codon:yes stop_codon:yes gene_type:complete
MNIYDRIKSLPIELENKIYKFVYFMNLNDINNEFKNLLFIRYGMFGIDKQKYYFNKKIKSILGIDLYSRYQRNTYSRIYNDYPYWGRLKQLIYINNLNHKK